MTKQRGQIASQASVTPSFAPQHDVDVLRRVAEAAVRPRRVFPPLTPPRSRFIREQEWLGRVDEVEDDYFNAMLIDMMGATEKSEATHVSWLLVSDQDVQLVRPGALFYWVIGYRVSETERRGESRLVFRRSVPWTPSEERRAETEAEWLWEHFAPRREP